jgi:hypothetical protein
VWLPRSGKRFWIFSVKLQTYTPPYTGAAPERTFGGSNRTDKLKADDYV